MDMLAISAFFFIHIGLAGLLGSQLRLAHQQANWLLVLVPAALVLFAPLMLPSNYWLAAYLFALIIVWLYAVRPAFLSASLWQAGFGLRYWGLAMLLVAIWGWQQAHYSAAFYTGSAAGVAGGLAWGRSLRSI